MKLIRRLSMLLLLVLLASCGGSGDKETSRFFCPMHPTIIDTRVSKCPICGMDLVKLDRNADMSSGPASVVGGRMAIQVPPERLQQIGLRCEAVTTRSFTNELRMAGTVEWDETRRARIAPRIKGFVEQFYVGTTGTRVEKGQALFRMYSPELRSIQIDLLEASKVNDSRLVSSARKRLELAGMTPAQVDALITEGRPADGFDYTAPFTGQVVRKMVEQGQSFMEGETLFELADLSRVWIHAFAQESDVGRLKPGQQASFTATAFPGRAFKADLTVLYPAMDQVSRTLQVRFEAENADLALRPDMWVELHLPVESHSGLAAPASALIDTGDRVLAFVHHGDGDLEPREVKIAARGTDYWIVTDGLFEDEQVVTRGLFLIDSESQFQAAIQSVSAQGGVNPEAAPAKDEAHQHGLP